MATGTILTVDPKDPKVVTIKDSGGAITAKVTLDWNAKMGEKVTYMGLSKMNPPGIMGAVSKA